MTTGNRVALSGVWMTYHTRHEEIHALRNVSLQVADSEFVSIVGPSGCGKSTILSLVAGLLRPSQGNVTIDGLPVTGPSPRAGYMLQQDYLYEWRTILQNATLGLEVQ